MDNKELRGAKVSQIKALRPEDQRVMGRLVMDRVNPVKGDGSKLDLTPLAQVFRRTVQDVSDIRAIFQILPELKLNRDILVSAVCAPGDLTTTTITIQGKVKGADTALTAMMDDRLDQHFVIETHMSTKVPGWIEDALVMTGAHPILILPEAALDRMIQNGVDNSSMESVSSFAGEYEHGWFKPKGLLGVPIPSAESKINYVSFESHVSRLNKDNIPEYHTIKVGDVSKSPNKKQVPLPFRVTDNLAALRLPAVHQLKRGRAIENALGVSSLEARRRERKRSEATNAVDEAKFSNDQIYSKFFRQPQSVGKSRLVVVPSGRQLGDSRKGHPLEYHLATESVMPATIPGDECNHVGYWVFLDGQGYPISSLRKIDYYGDIRKGNIIGGQQAGNEGGAAAELIRMSNMALGTGLGSATDEQLDRLADLNGSIIEADLIARLKAGAMGADFELSRTDHINKMLFARTCRNLQTTILFVPAELMVYMAYEYNEFGVGRSILEDAKTAAAIHSALVVADTIGSVKAAIPGKDITITLDADDKDPLGSATWMANEALGLAYRRFPMNISSPMGVAEELQMSAISVNIKGNPLFPEIETSVTAKENSYTPIDPATIERSRDGLTRVFSQTPEMIGSINNPDFATTLLQNNHMLLKRVIDIQNDTHPHLSAYVRTYTVNSGPLTDDLMEIIESNKKMLPKEYAGEPELFLSAYLDSVTATLPSPETDNLVAQLEMFDRFSNMLDKAIEAYIREEYFDGHDPDQYRDAIPTAVAALKGKVQRDWMRKRGILRELDIFGKGEDGKALVDMTEEMSNHVEGLKATLGKYMTSVLEDAVSRKQRERVEALRKLQEEADLAKAGPQAPAEPVPGAEVGGGNEFADASGTESEDTSGISDNFGGEENEVTDKPLEEPESTEPKVTPEEEEPKVEDEEGKSEDDDDDSPIKF